MMFHRLCCNHNFRSHPLEHWGANSLVLPKPQQCLFAQGQFEGLGKVTFDRFPGPLVLGVGLE